MSNHVCLYVEDVNTGYGKAQILWDVSLEVRVGEAVCVIGSNGAGKSTLMRTIMGLHPAWTGRLSFNSQDITNASTAQRVKLGMALVPEGRQLFAGLTVEDNLLLGAYTTKKQKISATLDFVYTIFPRLRDYRKRLAGSLSGGEQQMCAIGRALMSDPKILLVDEMSLGLAPVVVDTIIDVLTKVKTQKGLTLLLVEQDVGTALEITDRGYVLENGRIIAWGASNELLHDEHVKKAYLGL